MGKRGILPEACSSAGRALVILASQGPLQRPLHPASNCCAFRSLVSKVSSLPTLPLQHSAEVCVSSPSALASACAPSLPQFTFSISLCAHHTFLFPLLFFFFSLNFTPLYPCGALSLSVSLLGGVSVGLSESLPLFLPRLHLFLPVYPLLLSGSEQNPLRPV